MDNQTMNSQELQDLANLKELHKGKGIAATICGIISLLGCLGPIAFICGIVTIFVGANARKKSQKTTGTAGMVMGIIGVVLSILVTIIVILSMAGIMGSQVVEYTDKVDVSNDTMICDTANTAITTALYDPSCQDEESLEFIEYYGDGYYYDIYNIYSDDCAFALTVQELMGYDSYDDLCDSLDSEGAYSIEFSVDGYDVTTRVSGTDIEVY